MFPLVEMFINTLRIFIYDKSENGLAQRTSGTTGGTGCLFLLILTNASLLSHYNFLVFLKKKCRETHHRFVYVSVNFA